MDGDVSRECLGQTLVGTPHQLLERFRNVKPRIFVRNGLEVESHVIGFGRPIAIVGQHQTNGGLLSNGHRLVPVLRVDATTPCILGTGGRRRRGRIRGRGGIHGILGNNGKRKEGGGHNDQQKRCCCCSSCDRFHFDAIERVVANPCYCYLILDVGVS